MLVELYRETMVDAGRQVFVSKTIVGLVHLANSANVDLSNKVL